jgi:hypothetical protein
MLASETLAVIACNSDSTSDGGGDVTTEPAPDLCDIDYFTGNGMKCPSASSRVCFPVCDAGGGCVCTATDVGPLWQCTNPIACQVCNSSPYSDAQCPDASDGGPEIDADDAGDASGDAADAD